MTTLLTIAPLVVIALLLFIIWCYRVEARCQEIEREFFVRDAAAWRQVAGSLRHQLDEATADRNELRVRLQLADAKVDSQRVTLDRVATDIGSERLAQIITARRAQRQSTTCADRADFVAGELGAERAAAFRDHLATCESCPRELPDDLALRARLSDLLGGGR